MFTEQALPDHRDECGRHQYLRKPCQILLPDFAPRNTEFDHRTHAGKPARLPFPIDLPEIALNRFTVGMFNKAFFHKQLRHRVQNFVHFDPFFFPLDAIHNWNRMYGKSGLLQFQCVVPAEAMPEMLKVVSAAGLASFLAVLKVFGNVTSPGLMSFPKPGWTVALDFPIRGEQTFALFDRLAGCANDVGLLAEEIDTERGELLGNFPQAFSHVGLINAAWDIDQARTAVAEALRYDFAAASDG